MREQREVECGAGGEPPERGAAERHRAELAAVYHAITDAIMVLDRAGAIVFANGAMARYAGYESVEALRAAAARGELPRWELRGVDGAVVPPEDWPIARVLRGEAVAEVDLEARRVDSGERRWFSYTAQPVRDAHGAQFQAVVVARDVTARRAAEQRLRDSEERAQARAQELERAVEELEVVLDTVPAAVWIARDRAGDRIDANRLGAELLGRPRGTNVSVTAPGHERPTNFTAARGGAPLAPDELPMQAAARSGRESRDCELDLVFDDGTVRHLLGNATPLRDGAGRPRGAVGAFIDITDRKRAEVALRRSEQSLREADRRKDEFLGMLSHELRNPLAPIRNAVYLLGRADPASPQAERARTVIERQAEHLARLVDDLLDVTRIAQGKVQLRRCPLDLREVVLRAADDFRELVEARGLTLRVSVPPGPVWVDADPTRLAQVAGNLLGNAAKFTGRGGEIRLALAAAEDHLELSVRDDGAGIEPELLPAVFDLFVQGKRTLARSEGGLGLGLPLVKGIVELHGGTVRAASAGAGHGAELTVTLPLAADPTTGAQPGPRAPQRHLRVLVVDDNSDAATTLADLLELSGHLVDTAPDGPSGIAKARTRPPDVVLCDIGLPGMSGYDVARTLRADPALRGIRLVALTGYAQPSDRERARDAGFDALVAKPPDLDELAGLLGDRR